jgi:poly(U)-specific endoribonuclease
MMSLSDAAQQLWDCDENRLKIGRDVELNVQKGKKPFWKEDSATEPLFTSVSDSIWERPTFKTFVKLLDNYSAEEGAAENVTDSERAEVYDFLDAVCDTEVMKICHKYCNGQNPSRVPEDEQSFKKLLHTIWFETYNRQRGGREDSSGFEHVFVGEIKDDQVSGFHNWIMFYLEEKRGHVDYRGYIKPRGGGEEHDDDDYILTLQFKWKGVEKFVGSSFVATSPEFEFALYTLCFLAGEEENFINLNTGSDTFGITVKCYRMDGSKIGTSFPEVTEHSE